MSEGAMKEREGPRVTTFGSRPLNSPPPPEDPRNTFGSRPLPKSVTRRTRGLGRGLDSLIPAAPVGESDGQLRVPIGSIAPNPSQPRQEFDQKQLKELAASIREHGILQPLLVRPEQMGRYELIAGERRWRAAGLAGLELAPIVIQEDGGEQTEERLALALVENLQRADLNAIELATAFEQLSRAGWTQQRIATAVGKSRAAVANLLRLRRLPHAVQELIASARLSEGHGRALLAAPASEQSALAERTIANDWTVRQLEQAAKASAESGTMPAPRPTAVPQASPAMLEAVERLESALGTRVEVRVGVKGALGGGRIVVHWYDEEQLTALAAQMSGASTADDDAGDFGV